MELFIRLAQDFSLSSNGLVVVAGYFYHPEKSKKLLINLVWGLTVS